MKIGFRNNLHGKFADIFEFVKPTCGKVLMLRWVSVSKHCDQSAFCRNHRDDLKVVFPKVHLDAVPSPHIILPSK